MSNDFEDDAPEDEQFDAYLQRDSEVSQRYRELGGRAVPPALDAKVLRQAQQYSEKARQRTQRSWLRWGAPLVVAATALLAISVILQPGVQDAAAPMAVRAPEPAPPSSAEPQSPAAETAKLDEKAEAALSDSTSASDSFAAPRPPPATTASDSAPRRLAASTPEQLRKRMQRADEVERDAVAQDVAKGKRALTIERESAAAGTVSLRPEDRSAAKGQPPVSQPAAKPASAALAEERKEIESAKVEAGARHHYIEETRNFATPTEPAPESPPAAATPRASSALALPSATNALSRAAMERERPDVELDRTIPPGVWVKWIRDLRAEGKTEAAEAFLKRLRAAHPTFELPVDLVQSAPR